MGLHFGEDRWNDLFKGIEMASADLGFEDVYGFMSSLLNGCFGRREVQALASHLTVGETHFFRSPDTYAMLQSSLLPELISAVQYTTRRLRIWSAGCATGQEPYSIAILISRLLPKPIGWDITILGTDINPDSLAAAQAAEYTEWSFRGTPSWVINNYFTRTESGRYRLDPAICEMVTFRYLNLVEELYPSPSVGMSDFDLILCRNVMMYFSGQQMVDVAERLQQSLRLGGYLLTTPSESSRELMHSLTSTITAGEILYKKEPTSPGQPAIDSATIAVAGSTPPAKTAEGYVANKRRKAGRRLFVERRAYTRPATAVSEVEAEEPALPVKGGSRVADSSQIAAEARMFADRGDLEQALVFCEQAVEIDKLNPSLHYLKSTILQALGAHHEAERALQSTLFLDGGHVLARVMLGAIARGQSRHADATKHFRAALVLLDAMPSELVIAETEGLTAGEMAETVASLIGSERMS
jgi:chemotaxis protein methyltransferase CheR